MKLTVRKLEIDLAAGFARHWHGGDAFRSHYYNALSMSFPVGEQYFIDAVRRGAALLPPDSRYDELQDTVRGFVGQEATHRRIHGLYNEQLARQGLVNHWQGWAAWRIRHSQWLHPLSHLAVTSAYEHCTAVFADGTLRYGSWFDAAEPKMQTLWRWHAAEETEHRAVAFELYTALGGGWLRRTGWYAYVLSIFMVEAALQTASNLWHDRSLFKPRTWWQACTFFWGRDGAAWRCALPLLAYFGPRFHPDHERQAPGAAQLAAQWLQTRAAVWRAVGQPAHH
jgi:predicted metal-dependent hydrolase